MDLHNINKFKISEGTYGIVYSFRLNGHNYIKKKYKSSKDKSGLTDDLIRDVFHYTQPYSKINIYEFGEDYIILDRFKGDLYGLIHDKEFIGTEQQFEDLKSQILFQIYLTHSYGFIHSDLKISNILYEDTKNIFSLCDYGLSEYYGFPAIKKRYQCTSYFRPHKPVSRNTVNLDIYGFGCVVYYLENGLKNGYIRNIPNQSISENVKELLSMKSAKSIINIHMTDENEDFYNEIFQQLNIKQDLNISLDIYNHHIFIDFPIKNDVYHNYIFGNNGHETEYLEDMFLMYSYNPLLVKGHGNSIENKLKILEKYIDSTICLDTLFLSWLLVDIYDFKTDYGYKIALNFSCKLLEYYSYNITETELKTVRKIEINLLKLFFQKEITFTPTIFFLYYYLYNLAKRGSSQYYSKLGRLEGLGLSLLFMFFIEPKIYSNNLTYNGLTRDIILCSINYQSRNRLDKDEPLEKICINNSMYFPEDILRKIICDKSLLEWLIQNREHPIPSV